jgi:hypothetical protein
MPTTYTLINSSVLASPALSVTFSSIPSTYTDLVLRISARMDAGGSFSSYYGIFVNSLTSGFSFTYLQGSGTTASSARSTLDSIYPSTAPNTSGNTANTFTNDEIYIPNYTVSANKQISAHFVSQNASSAGYQGSIANLMSNTASINSLRIDPDGLTQNFVAGSSFYLYGIKNS